MKKLLLLVLLFQAAWTSNILAQLLQVVASSGGIYQEDEINMTWTMGETVIATFSAAGNILTQGFQQPGIVVTAVKSIEGLPYTVEAYPNPTDDLLLIQLKNAEVQYFKYLFYDMNGKVLEQKKLESNITAINMKNYPAGLYLLRVMKSEMEIKTFEIIKH